MKNITVNERIKIARKAFDKTIDELSECFNISARTISNFERSVSQPSVEYLKLLHTKFGISLNWLINGEGEMLCIHETNVVKIPEKGEVDCAAGNGCFVLDENITGYISFDLKLLNELGANIPCCDILKVKGDSMYPTFQTGDKVLVDTSQKEIIDNKIYIIRIEDELKIKRLHKLSKGKVGVKSDNQLYLPDTLDPLKVNFEICGRVLWSTLSAK